MITPALAWQTRPSPPGEQSLGLQCRFPKVLFLPRVETGSESNGFALFRAKPKGVRNSEHRERATGCHPTQGSLVCMRSAAAAGSGLRLSPGKSRL